jgi:hypothetical protein
MSHLKLLAHRPGKLRRFLTNNNLLFYNIESVQRFLAMTTFPSLTVSKVSLPKSIQDFQSGGSFTENQLKMTNRPTSNPPGNFF